MLKSFGNFYCSQEFRVKITRGEFKVTLFVMLEYFFVSAVGFFGSSDAGRSIIISGDCKGPAFE